MSSLGQGIATAGGVLAGGLLSIIPGIGTAVAISVGFSLGYAIGGALFPPERPDDPRPTDPFDVTGATEGTPIPIVFGTREVPGNIIYFDPAVEIEEITEGGGKGLGGGGEYVVEVRAFTRVHISLALGVLDALVGVYDGRRRDWEALNADYGGAPFQVSDGQGVDFGYAPESAPLRGVISVYSERLFLGEGGRAMTPLKFRFRVLPSSELGSPTAGLSTGVNPASVALSLLQSRQMYMGIPTAAINLDSFQAAYDIFQSEDRGVNFYSPQLATLEDLLEELNFHAQSVIRVDAQGRLELYPLRSWNYAAIPVAEEDIKGPAIQVPTWDYVDSDFFASFPDELQNYTQRTIPLKAEAVIDVTGKRKVRTYNFPWFTDAMNASRRLAELAEQHSFPNPVMELRLSKKYHQVRVGDVLAITHSKYDLAGTHFRVLQVVDPEYGDLEPGIRIRCRQERKSLAVSYTPPPTSVAPQPNVMPADVLAAMTVKTPWSWDGGPPPIPPPPGGPPPHGWGSGFGTMLAAARGSGADLGYLVALELGQVGSLPVNIRGDSPFTRWGYAFDTIDSIDADEWRYASGLHLDLQMRRYRSEQEFPVADPEDPLTSHWVLVVGGLEVWRWTSSTHLGDGLYRFEGLFRSANKEALRAWPAGTQVMVMSTRFPVVPNGMDLEEWAGRPQYVTQAEYDAGDRLKLFVHSINHMGQIQGPAQGLQEAIEVPHGSYRPSNEIESGRGPMVACQAFRQGDGFEWRAWYGSGALGSWVVEFQPFPDDATAAETDGAYAALAPSCAGQTYRLLVCPAGTEDPFTAAVRALDLVMDGSTWPAFEYTAAQQVEDGFTDGNGVEFYVTVLGDTGIPARPRQADKIGAFR